MATLGLVVDRGQLAAAVDKLLHLAERALTARELKRGELLVLVEEHLKKVFLRAGVAVHFEKDG